MKDKKKSLSTTLEISAIKKFFEYLLISERIAKNPAVNLKIPKIRGDNRPKIVVLSDDEDVDMIDNIRQRGGKWKERALSIVLFALQVGLRISEIIEMNLDDLNFETKFDKRRKRDLQTSFISSVAKFR